MRSVLTWDNGSTVISSPPRPTVDGHVTRLPNGNAKVIPYFLPLDVAKESMTMTVREWLRLDLDEEAANG